MGSYSWGSGEWRSWKESEAKPRVTLSAVGLCSGYIEALGQDEKTAVFSRYRASEPERRPLRAGIARLCYCFNSGILSEQNRGC